MVSEVKKKSWIRIVIRIITNFNRSLPVAETYLQKKNEDDISKIVTCREATDRQTNEITQRVTLSKTEIFTRARHSDVVRDF